MGERNPTMARLVATLSGARGVADIGCGSGALAKALSKRGFDVVGVDPQEALIEEARARVPAASFVVAGAEDMPLAPGCVDAAVILNALHHVPRDRMGAALAGSLRLVQPGGPLVVIEPLAEGNFFEAMQPVDDETEIRGHAIDALATFAESGAATLETDERYDIPTRFDGLDDFLDYLARAEPARADLIASERDRVAEAFERGATTDEDGTRILSQPMRMWVFRKA